LETFARFGARLDEDSRKIIEHGRRIRACLKQPEFAPVSVPAQIAVLLALTAELFDGVPLDRMTEAERAVQQAATEIPKGVIARLDAADKLTDEDRDTIIAIGREALAPFHAKPIAKLDETDEKTETKPEPERNTGSKSDREPDQSTSEAESEGGGESKLQANRDTKPKTDAAREEKP